jgi:hypothetical protein
MIPRRIKHIFLVCALFLFLFEKYGGFSVVAFHFPLTKRILEHGPQRVYELNRKRLLGDIGKYKNYCKSHILHNHIQASDPQVPLIISNEPSNFSRRVGTAGQLVISSILLLLSGNFLFGYGLYRLSVNAIGEYSRLLKSIDQSVESPLTRNLSMLIFISASLFPWTHDFTLPIIFIFQVISYLLWDQKLPGIGQITNTFFAIFYLAYLPSFWCRIRSLESLNPINSLRFLGFNVSYVSPWSVFLHPSSLILFWTWFSIASSGKLSVFD